MAHRTQRPAARRWACMVRRPWAMGQRRPGRRRPHPRPWLARLWGCLPRARASVVVAGRSPRRPCLARLRPWARHSRPRPRPQPPLPPPPEALRHWAQCPRRRAPAHSLLAVRPPCRARLTLPARLTPLARQARARQALAHRPSKPRSAAAPLPPVRHPWLPRRPWLPLRVLARLRPACSLRVARLRRPPPPALPPLRLAWAPSPCRRAARRWARITGRRGAPCRRRLVRAWLSSTRCRPRRARTRGPACP